VKYEMASQSALYRSDEHVPAHLAGERGEVLGVRLPVREHGEEVGLKTGLDVGAQHVLVGHAGPRVRDVGLRDVGVGDGPVLLASPA